MRHWWTVLALVFLIVVGVGTCAGCSESSVSLAGSAEWTTVVQEYCDTYIVDHGYANPRSEVSYMGNGMFEVILHYDVLETIVGGDVTNVNTPATDQWFRVTVHYDGYGDPEMTGGFE